MKPLLNKSESVPHEGCKGLPTRLTEELCGESVHIILGQNFSTQKKKKERDADAPVSVIYSNTVIRPWSPAMNPVVEECCRCFAWVSSSITNASSFAPRNRQREWQREIDGKHTKRKQGSASICATMCDRPVLLVLSLVDPCWIATREDRRGSSSFSPHLSPALTRRAFTSQGFF